MNDLIKDTLRSLYEGEMTFSEASSLLEVSKDEVEEMLESFEWVPSAERISELCEIEKETISLIENKNETVIFKVTDNSAYSFESIEFMEPVSNFSINTNTPIRTFAQCPQDNIVFSSTDDDAISYIQ
ncbi:hypothetical protein HWN40_13195 [Methanolobus zinderi]|uniref:Uncharacterized protein n=1 Tax=Methanolobus zinderi TaxID=536044 RepID=A0A7D5IQQ3_9EURY|nr:hypothetical protein [Methanolobus zinderi]QLC51105.1 hypothetical protein HWN40_13195 [Methanolobus zinderi]